MLKGTKLPGLKGYVDPYPPENLTMDELYERMRNYHRPVVPDNTRARTYQAVLDDWYDTFLTQVKEAPNEDRGSAIGQGTVAAFCELSPLSRHYGTGAVIEPFIKAFDAGLDRWIAHCEGLAPDEALGWGGGHASMKAYFLLEQHLSADIHEKMIRAVEGGAVHSMGCALPSGNVGNQASCRLSTDLNCAILLKRQDYLETARRTWEWVIPKNITPDGQVLEQYGPCHHYSYNSFRIMWPCRDMIGSDEFDEVFVSALEFFRRIHTRNGYNFAGITTRMHRETRGSEWLLLEALEFFGHRQPMYQKWADDLLQKDLRAINIWQAQHLTRAVVNSREDRDPTPEQTAAWNQPFARQFSSVYFGRAPIKYSIVHQDYSTMDLLEGWGSLKGIQTWAWGNEPPVIHPSIEVRSSTVAWGIDTAAHPISHRHGSVPSVFCPEMCCANFEFGSALWENADDKHARVPLQYLRHCYDWKWWHVGSGEAAQAPSSCVPCITKRQEHLVTVEVFTPCSTLIIFTGETGKRITQWALNRNDVAEPEITPDVVTFKGREARLYPMPAAEPKIEQQDPKDDNGLATVLIYESAGDPTAFAFSNDSFSYLRNALSEEGIIEFEDYSGKYRVDTTTIAYFNHGTKSNITPATVTRLD